MKIKFKEDCETLNYGLVKKGETRTVSKADGDAFIKNKKATKAKAEKKEVE